MEAPMVLAPPHLDYEAWKDRIRQMGGRFNPQGIDPKAFTGWVRPISVSGLTAAEVGSNAHRVERTLRDIRLDGADHFVALFQLAGRSAMTHNEEAVRFGFGDPDLDPCEVAARAGISLRYLQKLFTQRGSTCSEFIYSFRLDYAAHLLQRQSALGASRAFREIAYASGFRDYSHFARKFRQRFGHAPGAHFAGESCGREGALNACG